ncbi:MAG: hypothetical protein WCK11_02615 [Candidatus Falkowbacteria bacterium]
MKKAILFSMVFSLTLASAGIVLAENPGAGQIRLPAQSVRPINQPNKISVGLGLENPTMKPPVKPQGQEKGVKPKTDEQKPAQPIQGAMDSSSMENPNFFMATTSAKRVQEKISDLKEVKLYDNVKKVGKTLYGVKKQTAPKPAFITADVAPCVKAAIHRRADALSAVMSQHGQEVVTSLEKRTACEILALDKTTATEQFEANKLCIKAEQTTKAEIEASFEKGRGEAQKAFQAEVKQCVGPQMKIRATSTEEVSS